MIDDRNFAEQVEQPDESRKKKIWKKVGLWALAVSLAVFTVLVINISLF